ncbi:MAG TPA: type IV pilus assembly protein PilM [Candidatus Paceibacterota bacterium]|nr:type IV pilus assembly protein PilM [Candidatus Paceibacterota bacterium]
MANFFSTLLSSFDKKGRSALGIDIGSSSIKLVQLRKQGARAILETYGELALGPYAGIEVGRATNLSQDKIIEALKDLVKEANVTTRDSGFSIPAGASLLSFIRMPYADDRQLRTMIPIEARKYIPVPISEVSLDWWVIPKEEETASDFDMPKDTSRPTTPEPRMIDVLLVVIHNETLARMNQIVTGSGMNSSFFEIEIFSSMRSVVEQTLDPVMIFDMGAASTKLYIIERGILRSAHTVNRGSQDITLAISRALNMTVIDAEHAKRAIGITTDAEHKNMGDIITLTLEYIFSETGRAILNYQKRYNKNISRIVLTGGGSLLKGLLEAARTRFQTEIVLADPFSKTVTPAFIEATLRAAGPEFAVAIGIALRKLQKIE